MNPRPVVLLRKAVEDLEAAYGHAAKQAPGTAAAWLERFETQLAQLGSRGASYPQAPEGRRSPIELRQMLFGKRMNVYRVIFMIESEAVYVVRILRAQRRWLTNRQIRDALDRE